MRALQNLAQRPALIALLLALVAGVSISILTPPEMGGDERDHFTRAYQLSTGSILTHRQGQSYGAYLPRSFAVEEARLAVLSYDDTDRTAFLSDLDRNSPRGPDVFVSSGNNASYGPGAYADYAVAIAMGHVFGLSTLALLYLARLAGAITYAVLLSLAVWRLPVRQWVMVGVGLLPTAVNQASTVSADGLTMVLAFVLVAEALRLHLDEGAPRRRILVESAVATGVLALAKPPYVLVVLLFALPAWRFREQLLRPILAIGAEAVVLAALWGRYQAANSPSQANPKSWLPLVPGSYAFHDIRTGAQTVFVLTHPWSFLMAVGRTFVFEGASFPKELFGMLSAYQLPWLAVFLGAAFLIASCLAPSPSPSASPRLAPVDRGALIGVSLLVVLAIFAIAYTNWNQYRAPRIDAVNTRYMLPVLPSLLIGVLPTRFPLPKFLNWSGWRYPTMALGAATLVVALVGLGRFQYSHALYPSPAAVAQLNQQTAAGPGG